MEAGREIRKEEGEEYAREKNMQFIETSAKTNANIEDMFVSLASTVDKRFSPQDTSDDSQVSLRNLISLDQEEVEDDSCCS